MVVILPGDPAVIIYEQAYASFLKVSQQGIYVLLGVVLRI